MADVEGKKLTELRVIDLKTELERRGLDKTGNKAALLDRLSKAIIDDGDDPEECLIIPSGGVRASPKKPIDNSIMIEDTLESELQKNEYDSNVDDFEKSVLNTADNTEEPLINISAHPDELEMEYQESEQEQIKDQEQEPTVSTTSEESVSKKKPFVSDDESSNISAIETNGVDNEDSINLTIGEDEENLLAEEAESIDRSKDGGVKKHSEESDNVSDGSNSNNGSSSDVNNSNNNNNDNGNNGSGNNKKGDSKGSGRAEAGASSSSSNNNASSSSNKEGSSISTSTASSGASAANLKNKPDGEGSKSGDVTSKTSKTDEKASTNSSSRNLWVSGLSSTTRATDLKQIFSKYGKVVGAKVVTNARTPGARCYGYVTMSSSDDAEKCIENLHRTELHGRLISVEKAKGDSSQSHNRKRESSSGKTDKKDEKEKSKEQETTEKEIDENNEVADEDGGKKKKNEESIKETDTKAKAEESVDREKRENSSETKDEGSLKDCDTRSNKSSSKKSDRERGNSREDKKRSWDRSRTSRSKSRERHRRDNEERERQRLREKERLMREEKRRRREDLERQKTIEREAARIEREREKLRLERERIEQQKEELERERQLVDERKKLERERIELKRQQMRLEENRRGGPPPPPPPGPSSSTSSLKRGSGERPRETYEPERKRPNIEHPGRRHSPERTTDGGNRRMVGHGSSGPGARYDGGRSKDSGPPVHKPGFKRSNDYAPRNPRSDDQYDMSGRPGGNRDGMIRRDIGSRPHQNAMDHRPLKDRYERPTGFGRDRDVHRSDDSHRGSRDNHHNNRYDNSKPNNPRDGRYVDNNRQTGWQSGPPTKPFNSMNNRNEQSSGWNSRSSDSRVNNPRWNSNMGNNMGHPRSQIYQGGPTQSYGMSQGNSGSYVRFDPYNKGSMQNIRKY